MANDIFKFLPRELAEQLQHKQEMATLFAQQQQCTACRRSGGAVPFHSGGPRPYLAVILPSPSAFDRLNQAPMSGQAGDLFFSLIEEHVGLHRSQVFLAFAAACYSSLPPTAEEVAICQRNHRTMRYSGALVIWHLGPESAQLSTQQPWAEIVGKAHRRGLQFDVYLPDPCEVWRIPSERARITEDLAFVGELVRMPFLIDAWRVFAAGQQWSPDCLDELMGQLDAHIQQQHKARFMGKVMQALALGPIQESLF